MTGRDFQKEFELAASTFNELKDINKTSYVINYFLNEAQNVYINKRLMNLRNKVEGKQKDIDEIRSIVVRNASLVVNLPLSTSSYNVYSLPSDYLFLLNDRSITSRCNKTNEYENRLSPLENLHTILKYKYTSTKYNDPVSALSDNSLYIYKNDTFTIDDAKIDYVRKYNQIDVINNVTSELDENVHKEIVQLAMNIFLENVQSGRFKSNFEKNVVTEQVK
jgi:hypothetical protein